MRIFPRQLGRYSPPPAVLTLLVLEFVVTGVLLVYGVPWLSLLASAAPVITLTVALLSPTVQELGRRQPKLSVTTGDGRGQIVAPTARPWPVDARRVLANEVAEARETAKRRHSALDNLTVLSAPFAIRPSDADHERAQEKFETEVEDFESELRGWLAEYTDASRAYADTFEVTVALRNAASGAHAEAVTVVLDLPETVAVVEGRPTLSPPPDRPSYQPPRAQPASHHFGYIRPPVFGMDVRRSTRLPLSLRNPTWTGIEDSRRLEASAGDVHPDRYVNVGEPLFLRASGSGRHVIVWTAYTKSARKPATGTIALEIPSDPPRPAFGRLHGITSYPDVPFVDEDGEIVSLVRDSDPPARPEPKDEGDGPFAVLREAHALAEWRLLDLDPVDDGPERVEVRKAEPATKSA